MLIKCPECKKSISSYADKCVHCGLPAEKIEIETVWNKCLDCKNGKIYLMNRTAGDCHICKGKGEIKSYKTSIKK